MQIKKQFTRISRTVLLCMCFSAAALAEGEPQDELITDPSLLEALGFDASAEIYAAPGLDLSSIHATAGSSSPDNTASAAVATASGYSTLAGKEFRPSRNYSGNADRYTGPYGSIYIPLAGERMVQAQFHGLPDGKTITAFDIWWRDGRIIDEVNSRRIVANFFEVCHPGDSAGRERISVLAAYIGQGSPLNRASRHVTRPAQRVIDNRECYYMAHLAIPRFQFEEIGVQKVRLTYQ